MYITVWTVTSVEASISYQHTRVILNLSLHISVNSLKSDSMT